MSKSKGGNRQHRQTRRSVSRPSSGGTRWVDLFGIRGWFSRKVNPARRIEKEADRERRHRDRAATRDNPALRQIVRSDPPRIVGRSRRDAVREWHRTPVQELATNWATNRCSEDWKRSGRKRELYGGHREPFMAFCINRRRQERLDYIGGIRVQQQLAGVR